MKTQKIAVLAAILCLGAAVPAIAAWDNIGAIDVGPADGGFGMRGPDNRDQGMRDHDMGGQGMRDRDMRDQGMRGPGAMDRDVKTFTLGGPVERLQLRAERSDVNCRSVNASFANGQRRNIFTGILREGRNTDIDLPGQDRSIRAIDFNCGADRGPAATIRIVADIGRYQDEWRRNPNWQRDWARIFNWGSDQFNNWQMVSSESFEGRDDREQAYTGWRGRHVDAVALKPIGADVRCSNVVAHFDRRQQRLDVNNGDTLRQGQYYKIDLPGNYRNLESINLRCTPVGARRVEVQIFTSH
jgi:hypothetical protein